MPHARTGLPAALVLALLAGCGTSDDASPEAASDAAEPAQAAAPASPQDAFWSNLGALCESAAEGELLQAPDDQISPDARLVVHFWECGDEEIRFPLHVDENRSRTWVFIRHADGLELRHDHREPDGSESANTWYGASTVAEGTPNRQEFVNVQGESSSGWRVEIEPGERYTYGTIRNGEWRHHLVFDLASPVEVPPLHWGHEVRPSQRP
jgi:hypothetical protein